MKHDRDVSKYSSSLISLQFLQSRDSLICSNDLLRVLGIQKKMTKNTWEGREGGRKGERYFTNMDIYPWPWLKNHSDNWEVGDGGEVFSPLDHQGLEKDSVLRLTGEQRARSEKWHWNTSAINSLSRRILLAKYITMIHSRDQLFPSTARTCKFAINHIQSC